MNIQKFIFFIAFISTFFFYSCEDEPIDPDALTDAPAACKSPLSFSVSPLINGNTVSIDWDKSSGTGAWEIQYGVQGFVIGTGTTVNFSNTSSLIGGLIPTVTYDFYIRTRCNDGYFSVWIGPLSPGTGVSSCTDPTNVTAVRSTTDSTIATVTCSLAADANSWQVQFGPTGFSIGSGAILASSLPSRIISGLVPTSSYDVYVRSNCSENQNSNWVGPINIPTVGVSTSNAFFALVDGVEFVDVGAINVNPNSLLNSFPSIYIIATDAGNNVIEINIANDAVVGTEYFNNNLPTDKFRFFYFKPLPTELEVDTDGSLTITERTSTRIKGIFYFNALDQFGQTTAVTSGTFDVEIP